ncbi:MAG: efflux RND transporter periplasmic adaptor subunit [Phycisphaerales bacterium]
MTRRLKGLATSALFFVVGGAALTGVLSGCERKQNAYVAPPPPEVTVASPQQRDVPDLFETTGTLRAVERVEVRARVRGFVSEKLVKGGDRVKKGDVLFVIDPRPFEATAKQAAADVAAKEAALKLAEVTLARVAEAVQAAAVSKLELDKAQADRDGAVAQLELSKAALTSAKLNVEYTRVTAPMNGRVGIKTPDPGQLVAETDLLTELSNAEQVYASYTMDEVTLRRLREQNANRRPGEDGRGDLIVKIGYPGREDYPYEGRFARADAGVDASTGTIAIEAIFENPKEALLPGMFVRVAGVLGSKNVTLVPDVAVQQDQAGRYVYVVGADNKVERRNISVGGRVERLREVSSGLEVTDRVVVNGIQRCRPGSEVRAAEAKPAGTDTPAKAS